MLPLHHSHHETGTTGLEPAASRLTSECSARLSYVPQRAVGNLLLQILGLALTTKCAGGIRTHGLELMRLAGTAAPLPRKSDRLESNQRSPVPKTGGVADSPTTS